MHKQNRKAMKPKVGSWKIINVYKLLHTLARKKEEDINDRQE